MTESGLKQVSQSVMRMTESDLLLSNLAILSQLSTVILSFC